MIEPQSIIIQRSTVADEVTLGSSCETIPEIEPTYVASAPDAPERLEIPAPTPVTQHEGSASLDQFSTAPHVANILSENAIRVPNSFPALAPERCESLRSSGHSASSLARKGRLGSGINSYLMARLTQNQVPTSRSLQTHFESRCFELADELVGRLIGTAHHVRKHSHEHCSPDKVPTRAQIDEMIEKQAISPLIEKFNAVWSESQFPEEQRTAACRDMLNQLSRRGRHPLFLHSLSVALQRSQIPGNLTEELADSAWRTIFTEVPDGVTNVEGYCLGSYFSHLLRKEHYFFDPDAFACFGSLDRLAWPLLAARCSFLNLSYSNLNDTLLAEVFSKVHKDELVLDSLSLAVTPIQGTIFANKAIPKNIRSIDLTFCDRLDPKTLAQLAEFPMLESINLHLCDVPASALREIAAMPHLKELHVSIYEKTPSFLLEAASRGVAILDT